MPELRADDPSLTDSDVFSVLGNVRRREAIRYLATRDAVEVADVAEYVAGRESDQDIYRSVYVSLLQNHLPKMDDMGVIEYDAASGVVTPGQSFDRVYGYLDGGGDDDETRSTSLTPVAVATVGFLGEAANVFGTGPAAVLPDGVWGTALFASLAVYLLLR